MEMMQGDIERLPLDVQPVRFGRQLEHKDAFRMVVEYETVVIEETPNSKGKRSGAGLSESATHCGQLSCIMARVTHPIRGERVMRISSREADLASAEWPPAGTWTKPPGLATGG
jgi:hypothetical protein